jgi:hypothetical protein
MFLIFLENSSLGIASKSWKKAATSRGSASSPISFSSRGVKGKRPARFILKKLAA